MFFLWCFNKKIKGGNIILPENKIIRDSIVDIVDRRVLREAIDNAIFNEKQRKIARLYYLEKVSLKEISKELGYSESSVYKENLKIAPKLYKSLKLVLERL